MTPERVILNWRQAYRAAHGKRNAPRVVYRGGWFKIDGLIGSKRKSEVQAMTENLLRNKREGQSDARQP